MSYIVFIKDKNLKPENIKKGVKILKTMGILEAGGAEVNNQDKTVDSSILAQYITCDEGYTGLGTVTVNPYSLQSATVNSSTLSQTINPSTGYNGFSSVTVNPYLLEVKTVDASVNAQTIYPSSGYNGLAQVTVNSLPMIAGEADASTGNVIYYPGDFGTVQGRHKGFTQFRVKAVTAAIDSNIQAANIKAGVTILGVEGTYQGDTSILNQSKSVTPKRTLQVVTKDAGYSGLDDVTVYGVDSSIDSNITPSNIKSGVNILGVTGEYGGSSESMIFDFYSSEYVMVMADQNTTCNQDGFLSSNFVIKPGYWSVPGANTMLLPYSNVYGSVIDSLLQYEMVPSGGDWKIFIYCPIEQNSSLTAVLTDNYGNTMSIDGGNTWTNSVVLNNFVGLLHVKPGENGAAINFAYHMNNGYVDRDVYTFPFIMAREEMVFEEPW